MFNRIVQKEEYHITIKTCQVYLGRFFVGPMSNAGTGPFADSSKSVIYSKKRRQKTPFFIRIVVLIVPKVLNHGFDKKYSPF